jgi:iron(II)-dependent oxidoreductase
VAVEPFHIARAPVTQGEFAAFVDAGGYREKALWGDDGGRFLAATEAAAPVYWRRGAGGWERRCFDRWVALEPHQPMVHLSWFEARAFCRWAGRRLPSEAEWELAAAGTPATGPTTPEAKRRFPWGGGLPVTDPRGVQPCANLDGWALGPVDVAACATGDSAFGCRQMIGNVWEWTASTFEPYPGFSADPYEDYSQPWFGSRKVLRGGAWATRGRMLRNAWRNYFTPDRRDVPAGFRTCAGSEVGASTGRAS